MFAGDGGTYAGDSNGYFDNYAQNYLAAGYQIVQIAWGENLSGIRLGIQQREHGRLCLQHQECRLSTRDISELRAVWKRKPQRADHLECNEGRHVWARK
jgi:hypothetical protein